MGEIEELAQKSLPSWERGLKYMEGEKRNKRRLVAPLVGAWIEIVEKTPHGNFRKVAPLVGAWIEMSKK